LSNVLPIQNRVKRFRHPKGGATHYEPENEEHLKGKKVLVESAKKRGLNAKTEVMIGKHVTDVLIEGNQPFAVEFHCSKCNSKEISERTLLARGRLHGARSSELKLRQKKGKEL
jgi:competence CoiA-like predicted nuclease